MSKKNMEFLPLNIDGKRVYAGFWKRLAAAIVDMPIFILIIYLFHFTQTVNIEVAIISAVVYSFLFPLYSVVFNLKYGGTLGKLAVGIRVTKPKGEKIDLREALLRSSVDIFFAVLFAVSQVYAISNVDPEAYLMAGYIEQMNLISPLYPAINKYTNILSWVWFWSEMVVLLFNKRKRALHDYIAGTVVIKKEYEIKDITNMCCEIEPAIPS